jgi:hypothetical protein
MRPFSHHIQVIAWQAHAPTGLDGWIRFQNEAIRKCPNVPKDFAFPRVQPVPIECQNRAQPAGREIGPHQEVLQWSQEQRQNRCRAYDRKKLKKDVRAL